MTTAVSIRDRLRRWFPDSRRETYYRVVAGIVTFLLGIGVVDTVRAALWTQLGIAVVTTLLALLYSTSGLRSALYVLVGPVGAVLMAYGIARGVDWAIITSAVGQVFGIVTAAAKAQLPASPTPQALHQAS